MEASTYPPLWTVEVERIRTTLQSESQDGVDRRPVSVSAQVGFRSLTGDLESREIAELIRDEVAVQWLSGGRPGPIENCIARLVERLLAKAIPIARVRVTVTDPALCKQAESTSVSIDLDSAQLATFVGTNLQRVD